MNKNSGFVAGTLVHADQGLIPIQNIKVGDLVLSKPKNDPDANLVYQQVTQFLIKENQFIRAMYLGGPLNTEEDRYAYLISEFLFTSFDFSFNTFDKKGMFDIDISKQKQILASELACGDPLLHFSGQFIDVIENLRLYQTTKPDKAFYMVFPDYDAGIFLDVNAYKNNKLIVPNSLEDESLEVVNWDENEYPIADEYIDTVYHLEVEDFHTYFVGELGVWVHQ